MVQYVLDLNDPASTSAIVTSLCGHVGSLSVQKFSSNCVEKCLELASDKLRAKMIDELANPERLPRLLQDPYANYVLQKALSVSKKQQLDRLVHMIKPHLHQLKNTAFGKRIMNKVLHNPLHYCHCSPHAHPQLCLPSSLHRSPSPPLCVLRRSSRSTRTSASISRRWSRTGRAVGVEASTGEWKWGARARPCTGSCCRGRG